MKAWDVTIVATVRKTIRVTEEDGVSNEEEATELAHSLFTTVTDDIPEAYDEDTSDVNEVEI